MGIAPGMNIAFSSIDLKFGWWRLTYANFPLLYSAALFMVSQVVCAFMVSDLSKEYDLKAETEARNAKGKELPQVEAQSNHGYENEKQEGTGEKQQEQQQQQQQKQTEEDQQQCEMQQQQQQLQQQQQTIHQQPSDQ